MTRFRVVIGWTASLVAAPTPLIAALIGVMSASPPAIAGDRVDDIMSRGYLVCGLTPDRAGFAVVHGDTSAEGFDAEFCRGIAAALFGDPTRLRFRSLATSKEFLADGDIDVVFHELTWTLSRELSSGLAFGPIQFFDGQAFLARAAPGVTPQTTAATQFPNASVCLEAGQPFIDNLIAFIEDKAPGMHIAVLGTREDVESAFFAGACDLLTGDASEVYAAARARNAGRTVVLADRFSKEPLAPVVRQGDERLLAIVRWTVEATVAAEELGLTAANIDAARGNGDASAAFFDLAGSGTLGLPADWARNVVKAVGNYGEIYDRTLGSATNVTMARGLNALWTQGGLLYAPPLR